MTSFYSYRRRNYGPRCASPPTFVCYEMPQPESRSSSPTSSDDGYSGDECQSEDDYTSESDSHSEDDGSSGSSASPAVERMQEDRKDSQDSNVDPAVESMDLCAPGSEAPAPAGEAQPAQAPTAALDPKDIPCPPSGNEDDDEERRLAEKREGKKREVVPDMTEDQPQEDAPRRKKRSKRTRRHREAPAIRPILTIRSSQGFVWNQDLFVPPYVKDRYIASSPPSSIPVRNRHSNLSTPPNGKLINNNFFSTSNEADYEVECVEIRVEEGELDSIIPRS
ncbi:hypothetical protein FRC00_004610 [Tulasnella sp. 408]|nr:hypothetical protein FRC00_004610 [Tulasnella sp. 408]